MTTSQSRSVNRWLAANPEMRSVFPKVRDCLMESLGVDEAEVTPDADIVNDLGAESIDYLQLMFMFEKSFSISITRDDFLAFDIFEEPESSDPETEKVWEGHDRMTTRKLTPTAYHKLQERQQFRSFDRFEDPPWIHDIVYSFTVEDVCWYILRQRANRTTRR